MSDLEMGKQCGHGIPFVAWLDYCSVTARSRVYAYRPAGARL
ncbi:hypothetical protein Thpro_021701 [Acidihalobacter prosperus]|uniref:Uncharacterized protein n=1 Tax=Acidihalobacter prosperus TaxID=160660 RepID=A0A1A6C484_9GAMM|nr:hypothetical protein Thpro_021701 [Acidihalobacter prosperus]